MTQDQNDGIQDSVNQVLNRLRELLTAGDFGTAGRLPPERALAQTLKVGRRAIRLALDTLEVEGLIWRRQGSGTFVGERSDPWIEHVREVVAGTDFMELMEVRLRIEPQFAQLAAVRATRSDVEKMRDLARKMAESTDADSKELWDGALHRLIAQAAGNQLFLSVFDVVNLVRNGDVWRAIKKRARANTHGQNAIQNQHADIIDAIAARDPTRAGEVMREHLMCVQAVLIHTTSTLPTEFQIGVKT